MIKRADRHAGYCAKPPLQFRIFVTSIRPYLGSIFLWQPERC